ncbi:mfs transporter [Moniliophthora roreri]|nr:mfs transporter [Moniliophthora roreri]
MISLVVNVPPDMQDSEKVAAELKNGSDDLISEKINWAVYHEEHAGRLIIDPREAKIEFGEETASKLKLSRDGSKVLWPQPTDSPKDPQNWSDRRKALHLFIITLAAIILGIASLFALAAEYNTTTGVINNVTSNWSIFLLGLWCSFSSESRRWTTNLGPGGVLAVWFINRYGRLPVLFWSQVFALGFLIGCTFAPNLSTFAGEHPSFISLLNGCLSDIQLPSHEMPHRCFWNGTANFWFIRGNGFVPLPLASTNGRAVSSRFRVLADTSETISSISGPWDSSSVHSFLPSYLAFGFLVARENWRWSYGIGSMYGAVVCVLIALFMEETMYDRKRMDLPEPGNGLRYRLETLTGVTGIRMAKYRVSWFESIATTFRVVWRPHLLGILIFEGVFFGFGIGINVTMAVFLGSPPPLGFGWSELAIAGGYGTPIVAIIIGELIGRFVNDWIMNISIKRNKGVFEAESRLWYNFSSSLCVPYMLSNANPRDMLPRLSTIHLRLRINRRSIAETFTHCSVDFRMGDSRDSYHGGYCRNAYCNDCFPGQQGEISALVNLARTLGGFSVAYFQVPWAEKHGALQTFGCEAAIVVGLFCLIIPPLQTYGRQLRARFSL